MKRTVVIVAALGVMLIGMGSANAAQIINVPINSGGATASGNDLLTALSGISGNSYFNRYVIKLEPGIYDVGTSPVIMKTQVDIEGSGIERTLIRGTGASTSSTGVVIGADSSELRDLMVLAQNGTYNVAFHIDGTSPRLYRVRLQSRLGDYCWGIRSTAGSPTIEDVEIEVSCTETNSGISSLWGGSAGGHPTIVHTDIHSTGGDSSNYGIYVESAAEPMRLDDIYIYAGNPGVGIDVSPQGASPSYQLPLVNSRVVANNGIGIRQNNNNIYFLVRHSKIDNCTTGIALDADATGTVVVDSSVIEGTTNTVANSSGTVRVGLSKLDGGPVVVGTGTVTCTGVIDETNTFYTNTCP